MPLALALMGLVQAQSPVLLEHRIPATTQVGATGTALIGGDGWVYPAYNIEAGGPGSEYRLTARAEYGYDRTELWVQGAGLFELWTDLSWLDVMAAEMGLRNAAGPGVYLGTRASAGQQWLEANGGLAYVRPGLQFNVGPLGRVGVGTNTPGARTEVRVMGSPGPRWSLWTGWGAAIYGVADIPTVVTGTLGAQFGPSYDTRLGASLAAVGSLSDNPISTLGLPPGGSQIWRGDLWLRHWFTRSFAVHTEVGTEQGTGSAVYERYRVMFGLHLSLGIVHSTGVQTPAGQVLLRLDVPDAIEVAVAGSFTDWEPVPMERVDERWEVAVELPPGEHEYIYLVDGQPLVPPEAPNTRDDGFGGENGVLVVAAPTR